MYEILRCESLPISRSRSVSPITPVIPISRASRAWRGIAASTTGNRQPELREGSRLWLVARPVRRLGINIKVETLRYHPSSARKLPPHSTSLATPSPMGEGRGEGFRIPTDSHFNLRLTTVEPSTALPQYEIATTRKT